MIAALAVLGRSNGPLYLKCLTGDPLAFQFIVHASLDVIEDKLRRRGKGDGGDNYLGQLLAMEEYRVYGYVTNTSVKITLVLSDGATVRDNEVKALLSKVHAAYIAAVSNPFYAGDALSSSVDFESNVTALLARGLA